MLLLKLISEFIDRVKFTLPIIGEVFSLHPGMFPGVSKKIHGLFKAEEFKKLIYLRK